MKPHTPSPSELATEYHREALDRALRLAMGTSQPALRQQALADAAAHLIHPRLILETSLLADNHVWRREALAISDAFEAVTNGMEEPELLESLEALEPGSPFQPWRHWILALHFYYEGLDEAMAAHLHQIPSASPVAVLSRTLSGLQRGRFAVGLSASQRRLVDLVSQPDPAILQSVQDVAEGLETENEELFWASLSDWLERIAGTAPERAKAAVLWAWGQLEWRDFDEAVLLNLGTNVWSSSESYRLAALGTAGWDPEGSSLLWFRFLISAVRDGSWDEVRIREAREMLDKFREAVASPSPEWGQTWEGLARIWGTEISLRNWTDLSVDAGTPEASPPIRPATSGQLDLFS